MDESEEGDLRRLLQLLDKVDRWRNIVGGDEPSGAHIITDRSGLWEDDRRTHPYRTSHRAWSALTASVDFLHCLRHSLIGELRDDNLPVRLHTYGQLALVRGAVENAACATWLIAPPNRAERITNRLALEWKELTPAYRLSELSGSTRPRTKDVRKAQLIDLLLKSKFTCPVPVGVDVDTVRRSARKELGGLQYVDIVRRAGELTDLGSDLAEVMWSVCSGVAHGDAHATLAFLTREVIKHTEPGVKLLQVSAPVFLLFMTTLAASLMLDRAFAIYERRAAAPY